MNIVPSLTRYPPPPASQPAIEGAQSGGRPWITLRLASDHRRKNIGMFNDKPKT